jgi:hemerythrin-like domain-containing protein
MKSTQLLTADHEIVLDALQVLKTITSEAREAGTANWDDVLVLLDFLREFADGSHHVKEECIFFPALVQAGMPLRNGRLYVMSTEHRRSRAFAAAMREAASSRRLDKFVAAAERYGCLSAEHIEKEHSILFHKAEQLLGEEDDANVADAFEEFDATVGAEGRERLRRNIEMLTSKYCRQPESYPRSAIGFQSSACSR